MTDQLIATSTFHCHFRTTPSTQHARSSTTEAVTRKVTKASTTTTTELIEDPFPGPTEVVQVAPSSSPPKLDTSGFILHDDDYDSAYFDLEKIPSYSSKTKKGSHVNIETSSFEYPVGGRDEDVGNEYHYQDYEKEEEELEVPAKSTPAFPKAPSARLPIRQVLDIFQELKLSFGRGQGLRRSL